MEIKKATTDDIEAIQQLSANIWPVAYKEILRKEQLNYMLHKFYSMEALKDQMLTKGHQFYLLVNEHKDNIGFASVSMEDKLTFKLQKLYILPQQQGKNLGKMLLNKVIQYCTEKGGKSLILNVNRYNKARFFYEKCGFKIIEEIDIAIGNNYFMNDYVMKLNL
jgi:ribosomal protein S18 acetylase RimI-like enzyme